MPYIEESVPLGTQLLGSNFQIIKGYNQLQNPYLGTVDFPINFGFGGKKKYAN